MQKDLVILNKVIFNGAVWREEHPKRAGSPPPRQGGAAGLKKSGWFSVLQGLTWLTQLGLSLAVPPLLCLLGAGWLARQFSLGPWVWVLGILLGLGAAGCTFAGFARMFLRQNGGAGENSGGKTGGEGQSGSQRRKHG